VIKVRVAVCDDEKNLREDIKSMIKAQCADCHVDLYDSGESLLAAHEEYDIYFLDIQMAGMNGMETASRIRTRETAESKNESIIVFVTSFTDFWGEAFDVKAFHYLVKPIDKNKFNAVFTRAAAEYLDKKEKAGKHILIKNRDSYHKVLLSEIFYLESQNKKVTVISANGAVEHYGKMQDLESVLGDTFFRCHRCYIVNMEHITKYNATTIWLKNGKEIFLAHKKYPFFVKAYMSFLKSGGTDHG
jgi:DNA-binding LytR/AlgR family response regulator